MNDLYSLLVKIKLLMSELVNILTAEEKELNLFKVNAIVLQSLVDNKSRVITAINFYDNQRDQLEQEKKSAPPYSSQTELAEIWSMITEKTRCAAELNEKIRFLIERQMQNIQSFKTVIKELQEGNFIYEPGGDKESNSPAHFYHISV